MKTLKTVFQTAGVIMSVLVFFVVLFSLIACGTAKANDESITSEAIEDARVDSGMVCVYKDTVFRYYKDNVTDVMYVLYVNGSNGRSLSAMWDPDTGMPLTYERYNELQSAGQYTN